jgi:gas vesicle protein
MTDNEDQIGRDPTSFFTGLALGALLGAGLALLFAPASGEETRRVVRRRARGLSHQAAEGLEDARDATRRLLRDKKEALRARLAQATE